MLLAASIPAAVWAEDAKLRVTVRRDGQMIPATVMIHPPNAPSGAIPASSQPANQKFTIASGTYDLVVKVDAQGGKEAAWVRVLGVKASGPALKEIPIELADGTLEVTTTDNGAKAEGAVRAFREGAATPVNQGPSGTALVLPPGPYRIEVVLSGASDYPHHATELWIEPKKTARLAEKFETGRLTVGVFRERQPVEALVQLALPGANDFFNYFSAPGTVSLSPGTYDVLVKPKGAVAVEVMRRPRVAVVKGKENKIFFDLTPAKVTAKVIRAGKAVPDADVRVVVAGGEEEAAKQETDGSFRLSPGRYELIAKLPDGDTMRDGPFEVGFGESLARTLEFERGQLTVQATRGKTIAEDAEVFVFRKGAQKPIAQGRSGAILELAPGTYDVKVTAGTETVWREAVKVQKGKPAKVEIAMKPKQGETMPEGDPGLPEGE